MSRSIILAAGGTGGHLFPADALATALRRRGWRTHLVTDKRGAGLKTGFAAQTRHEIPASRLGGRNPLKLIAGLMALGAGTLKSLALIRRTRPALVAGFGGYPSFPLLLAARLARVRSVIHEQNCVLGRTNRLFAARAALVASGFEKLDKLPASAASRHVVTGNPLRPDIIKHLDDERAKAGGRLHLLVMGGSLGARILGETVPAAIALLPQSLQSRLDVAQQTRQEQMDTARQYYDRTGVNADLAPFFDDVAEKLAAADLVIARAGASSIAEIAALGKPSILVPLAIAMDDHQSCNAQVLADAGAADIIAEETLTPERLAALITARLGDPDELERRGNAARSQARPGAAETLADCIETLGGN